MEETTVHWSFVSALFAMFNTVAVAAFAFYLGRLDQRVANNRKDINNLGNTHREHIVDFHRT